MLSQLRRLKTLLYMQVFVCMSHTIYAATLSKVFYHNAVQASDKSQVTNDILGILDFYLSEWPTIREENVTINSADIAQKIFILDDVSVQSAEVKEMIEKINQNNNGLYSITLAELPRQNGLKIAISYNPKQIEVQASKLKFTAIKTKEPGLAIIFLDKQKLKNIVDKPVLRTAQAKKEHCIVIDCGHGGHDYGAVGFFNLKEKDITLDVGLQVADLLKKKGFTVHLTRDDDFFVPLDKRTSDANCRFKADLFVSIHANFSANMHAQGIETYCLSNQLFTPVPGEKFFSQINKLLTKYSLQSDSLATQVHKNLLMAAGKKNLSLVDRKVKNEVSQVLFGAIMPAALVELGFVSNQQEAALLKNKDYRVLLAQGICQGIVAYCKNN